MNTQTTSAIEKAVAIAGGVAQLAEACGLSAQAVYKWIKKGYPPTDRCEAIERAVNGRVTRIDLLPPSFASAPKRRSADQVKPP